MENKGSLPTAMWGPPGSLSLPKLRPRHRNTHTTHTHTHARMQRVRTTHPGSMQSREKPSTPSAQHVPGTVPGAACGLDVEGCL